MNNPGCKKNLNTQQIWGGTFFLEDGFLRKCIFYPMELPFFNTNGDFWPLNLVAPRPSGSDINGVCQAVSSIFISCMTK